MWAGCGRMSGLKISIDWHPSGNDKWSGEQVVVEDGALEKACRRPGHGRARCARTGRAFKLLDMGGKKDWHPSGVHYRR